jgi:hypothetical protein
MQAAVYRRVTMQRPANGLQAFEKAERALKVRLERARPAGTDLLTRGLWVCVECKMDPGGVELTMRWPTKRQFHTRKPAPTIWKAFSP